MALKFGVLSSTPKKENFDSLPPASSAALGNLRFFNDMSFTFFYRVLILADYTTSIGVCSGARR
ncbi:hypothetical protein CANTEDRAFT_114808 [Yamadazyma tenuis ATCC 10573]|uniref:Uncharacterized protein n=1 Tax=Candida tenuis (strain ATCC 10573 / BCRC 21748 / CBS 615 / JCM 9827 / NBRC 10315 / NRRL Y-1498 / VKM Y-70) TaxID=590646 RepID=G3B9W5_CANTC|nr:uncharacterized protein CANTEDRAFT_114808 [Yamadazyma tenuis ATCC 10573]EGV61341.1 hypothetical protein CANTEDRAFT_114808 [Yamadazyma tenuis ATCC 10573]